MPEGEACYYQGLDYFVAGCGYANLLKLIDNDPAVDAASWFTGPRAVDEDLSHPSDCQQHCAEHAECAYFSFETQDDVPTARCYLKEAYADPSCVGYSALRRTTQPSGCAPCVLEGARACAAMRAGVLMPDAG